MSYIKRIAVQKGTAGTIDGTIAAVITGLVMAGVKSIISDMDANTENALAGAIGVAVSAGVIGAKKYIENWLKHRKDK
jgi:hypothetical protein